MSNSSILIVGAGPTGMTAAIELKRAGFDVRIIDKSEHMAQHSQALVVQARTLEQFQRYGFAGAAVARGRKLHGARFFSEGREIVSIPFDRLPSRFPFLLFLPQSETELLLNKHMENLGVKAERRVELEALSQDDGAIRATLRHPDDNLEQVSVRWIVGCDGAHSLIREQTGTPFEGKGVGLAFFLGDFELEGPDVPENWLTVHAHHGDIVFMARLNDKLTRVIVALHGQQEAGIDRVLTIEDFQQAADDAGVRVQIHSSEWMTPFHVSDRQAAHYRIGNAFLAGDASHIHSPVGGQGMNTGIQDVANLAWKLAAVDRGADDRLLNSYEEERGEVGKALLRFTERGLKVATVTNPLLESVRDLLAPLVSSLEPVQRALIEFIAETGIEYRSSSIVVDRGGDGDLKPGDRLPDLALKSARGETTLLHDWTAARHLVLMVNASPADLSQVQSSMAPVQMVAIHPSELDGEGTRLLGTRKKLVIVRPDGYVGFRGPIEGQREWRDYARQDGLLPRVHRMVA